MADMQISRSKLLFMVLIRFSVLFSALLGCLLLFAGTLAYWQAWMYMAILLVPMCLVLVYLMIKDPALLVRRMQFREKEPEQKRIIKLGSLVYLFIYIVPGLDRRFGWSEVPLTITILSACFVFTGYAIFVLVMKVNSYASRTVEVVEGQQLISTGPYALVRHPMYAGNIIMYLATPVSLGSWWGLVPALLVIPLLVVRIINEESVLLRDLHGYDGYIKATRYRLIPGGW